MNYLDKVEHLSFGQCVRGAWRDAWQSIMNRPAARGLALACVAVYAIRVLVQLTFAAEMAFDGGTGPFVSLFQSAVSIILSVQAIRYVVLGADEARASGLLDRGFWRYLRLYAMVLLVLFIALMGSLLWLYMVVHDSVYRQVWTVLAALFAATVFVYVHTRLTLLFCHVSIGGSMRWRAAWRDTRGRFWRFVAVQFVVALPVIAVLLVSLLLVSISGSAGGTSEVWLIEFVAPLASLAMSVQAASCSAWLYRRYANEIRE